MLYEYEGEDHDVRNYSWWFEHQVGFLLKAFMRAYIFISTP